jgi:hypothetical protein
MDKIPLTSALAMADLLDSRLRLALVQRNGGTICHSEGDSDFIPGPEQTVPEHRVLRAGGRFTKRWDKAIHSCRAGIAAPCQIRLLAKARPPRRALSLGDDFGLLFGAILTIRA